MKKVKHREATLMAQQSKIGPVMKILDQINQVAPEQKSENLILPYTARPTPSLKQWKISR